MALSVVFALVLGLWLNLTRTAKYYREVSKEYDWFRMIHESHARAYDQLAGRLRNGEKFASRHFTDFTLLRSEPKIPVTFPRRNEPLNGRPRLFDADPAKDIPVVEGFAARALVRASYFENLSHKYREAAERPWIPAKADDPPPP